MESSTDDIVRMLRDIEEAISTQTVFITLAFISCNPNLPKNTRDAAYMDLTKYLDGLRSSLEGGREQNVKRINL